MELTEATVECARITHRHPLAVAAAVAQNHLVRELIEGRDLERARSVLTDQFAPTEANKQVRAAIHSGTGPDGAVAVLAEAVEAVDQSTCFQHALTRAVSTGGDTETRGAVAGLLAGARWGFGSIPEPLTSRCPAALGAQQVGLRLAAAGGTATKAWG